MEKILLAMDGHQENTVAIDFACYLAKLTDSRLIGVFLAGLPDTPAVEKRGEGEGGQGATGSESEQMEDPVQKQMRRFREIGFGREVAVRVHRDQGIPLVELLKESRFSDLIVIDPETSFRTMHKEFPGRFVSDVLIAAECPVFVSPYRFEAVDEVIFAYNGTGSSVFAIKQFTYLFPVFQQKKAIVVHVTRDTEGFASEQANMKEWLSAHYGEVNFVDLKGKASDELFGYLLEKKNALVVLGAYGRGMLSRFLKPSHASLLLRTINLPIFIAHR